VFWFNQKIKLKHQEVNEITQDSKILELFCIELSKFVIRKVKETLENSKSKKKNKK